jgi:hypothetical protein
MLEVGFMIHLRDKRLSVSLCVFVLAGLENLNQRRLWKDSKVQKQFSNSYGSEAKMRFDQAYDNSKRVC